MDKVVNKLIDESVKGVDTYSHNGSTWLIFTESKQWVIELTESKTLWYNYNFFNGMFNYVSMDVVENQHYITKWVEDNIIGGGVKRSLPESFVDKNTIDYIIQTGVKETIDLEMDDEIVVDNIIENGVKETNPVDVMGFFNNKMDDALENGVKSTLWISAEREGLVNTTINQGVKETQFNSYENKSWIDGVIKNGVKETKTPNKDGDIKSTLEWMYKNNYQDDYNGSKIINKVIKNGVKEIYHYKGFRPRNIGDIIENGVKETQPLPDQSGELRGYGDYYDLKEDRTKPFIDYLEETINFGVKN
jgi:hypothetical protein